MFSNFKILIGGPKDNFAGLYENLTNIGFEAIQTENSALEIQCEIFQTRPDFIFLSSEIHHLTALINTIKKLEFQPHVYIICPYDSTDSISKKLNIVESPYLTLLTPPLSNDSLANSLIEHVKHSKNSIFNNSANSINNLHNFVSDILSMLCITPNYNGFIYLRESIKILVNEPISSRSFSKCIYPQLSKQYNTSIASIERNIRTVIQKGWEKATLKTKAEIFGSFCASKDWRPTNGEFILVIADKISRELDCATEKKA